MDGKAEFLIMGSIAAVVVVIIAVKGKGTTIGATFSNPDSASVAAVTSAGASEIDSINKLTLSKMQTAASTIVAIAQLQTGLDTAKVNAGAAEYGEAQATQQVGLQTSAATKQVGLETAAQDYAALQSATASIKTSATSAAAQEAIAKLNDSASTAAAKINAGAAEYADKMAHLTADNVAVQQAQAGVQEAGAAAAAQESANSPFNAFMSALGGGITSVAKSFIPSLGSLTGGGSSNSPVSNPANFAPAADGGDW